MSIPFLVGQNGIAIDKSFAPENLVRDIFVKGSCDNVNNISSIGDPNGIGYFENGKEVIGIDKGIIISTGDINGALGPNKDTRHSGNFKDEKGDKDLQFLATGKIRDAVGIEFDFVPLDSIVSFRYVFASEEYCEFVGQKFNDVFGFFISGPGINGRFSDSAENVALIPGTDDIVAINSVNHLTNSDFFEGNFQPVDIRDCNLSLEPSKKQDLIQYDGFTKVLAASLKLIPCQTYHIRFVISDVEDHWFDSAVFLEAGSFNLGGEVRITTRLPAAANGIMEEGCDTGTFLFERANPATMDIPLTVRFKVSDLSNATEGMDFDTLPDFITIPANQMTSELSVKFINDYRPEPPEKIILELDIPCACYTGLSEITIVDSPSLEATLPDSVICYGEGISISPMIFNGTPPYTYQWEDSSSLNTLQIDPTITQNYRLTISDQCANIIELENKVKIRDIPTASISGNRIVCEGDQAFLNVDFQGTPPYNFTYGKDNSFAGVVSNIDQDRFKLPLSEEGRYQLISFSDNLCDGTTNGEGSVKVKPFSADWEVSPASCSNTEDGAIHLSINDGKEPYAIQWSNNLNNDSIQTKLRSGLYAVSISDADNCSREYEIEVEAPAALQPVSFRCEDLSVGLINIRASGGTPPYQYSIDGNNFEDKGIFYRLQPGENYQLTILDEQNCKFRQDFLMPAASTKMIDIGTFIDTKLGIPESLTPTIGIPESLIKEIEWQPVDALSCNDCLLPEILTLEDLFITVRLEDVFGCTGSDKTYVRVDKKVNVFIPDAFSPNGDGRNDHLVIFANHHQIRRIQNFVIYDRWGNQVFGQTGFSPNDPKFGWDGKYNGKPAPVGIYPYKAQAELIDGSVLTIGGQISLLR